MEQEQVVRMVVVEQDKMVGVEQLDLARTGSISPTSTSDSTEVDSSSCSTAAAAGTFKIYCRYSGKKQIVAISLNAILIEICVSPIGNLVAWESERKTRPEYVLFKCLAYLRGRPWLPSCSICCKSCKLLTAMHCKLRRCKLAPDYSRPE